MVTCRICSFDLADLRDISSAAKKKWDLVLEEPNESNHRLQYTCICKQKLKNNPKTQLWVERKEREKIILCLGQRTYCWSLNKNPTVKTRLLLNWIVSLQTWNYKSMEQSLCCYGKQSVWTCSLINFRCWTKQRLALWPQLMSSCMWLPSRARDASSSTWDWRGLGRWRQIHWKAKWQQLLFFYENRVRFP